MSNPASPFLSFCEPGLEDVPIVAPVAQLPDAEDVVWLGPEPEPAHSPTEIPSTSSEEED